MRYRELPGWESTLDAARRLWDSVPEATWSALGELEAPAYLMYLRTANELFMAATSAGLVHIPQPRR